MVLDYGVLLLGLILMTRYLLYLDLLLFLNNFIFTFLET